MIDFQTRPEAYRHWKLTTDGPIAHLEMNVDPDGGLHPGYELKLNSYDLGVDIELYDAVQRLRFEHPEVRAVVIRSALDRTFCAGANIGMLAAASHPLKVNFCKFTNETRSAIEDATARSGQRYLAAVNGTAAGGGYELALATDYIMLVDDRSASVSLPEVPLLGVLPGTGGLTRLADKRHVRRDLADIFCTLEEGLKGSKARDWNLVDELVPASSFQETVDARARQFAAATDGPASGPGVTLTPLDRTITDDGVTYSTMSVQLDRSLRTASILVNGPDTGPPSGAAAALAEGADFWPLRLARELDDALLHLRVNEWDIGTVVVRSQGDLDVVLSYDAVLVENPDDWFIREVTLYWARLLRRVDMTSRTVLALIEPGSCFGGFLAELTLAADRSYMLEGAWSGGGGGIAQLAFTTASTGALPMSNDLARLETRFWGDEDGLGAASKIVGEKLDAVAAHQAGVVTDIMDDIDWETEIRMLLEARASFSPDALTGLESNLRFPGPETMETKIFGRLTAWQNWVFSRPNASGEAGALRRYGTGIRPDFDTRRV
ncbi:MAG TPA: 2,3-epoxybenzoyl-CoA dihydrolase [Acidimicrobiia bacterium]|nr:2,3-epoxybenzoyl-CoA dihydrolase [Acidimicrobiia bacterium]